MKERFAGMGIEPVAIHIRFFGLCCAIEDLGIGVLVHPSD